MVNTYELKLTVLQQKILRLLFVNAGFSLNSQAISRLLKVSPPAVAKSIPFLVEKDLIKAKQDSESRRWAIELNGYNHKVIQLKRADNLKIIYESGLADFLEEKFAGATLVIFGSYSRGDDTFNSDIDIAVIGRKDRQLKLEDFEKMLNRKININFYNSWKDINKHLKNNILNGIVLAGSVDL